MEIGITRRGGSVLAFWSLFIGLSIIVSFSGLSLEVTTFEGFVVNALIVLESLVFGIFVATLWQEEGK